MDKFTENERFEKFNDGEEAIKKNIKKKKITKKKTTGKWTSQEYTQLINLVREHGEEWDRISKLLGSKNSKQCMQKFKNSQRSAKKGNWSSQEDRILLDWVDNHGPTKWTECSKLIRGRCGKQCRERWVNILNPGVKKGNWSDEEQEKIFQSLSVHYTSWSSMSKLLPGRTENSIKNYFYSSIRRLKSNPIIEIFRDLYIKGTKNFTDIAKQRTNLNSEIVRFNRLSQKICEYLLDPSPKEPNFFNFLTSVLLEQKTSQPQQPICIPQSTFQEYTQTPSFFVPKEVVRTTPQNNIPLKSENDQKSTKQIFDALNALKNCAQQKNQSNLIQIIKFLEMQLVDNTAKTYNQNEKIKISVPYCWNCVANNCTTHQKQQQFIFFQFNTQFFIKAYLQIKNK